jgi:nitronate monooxygenase
MANIGHQQTRKNGSVEPALITVGDDLNTIAQFIAPGRSSYSAADVVENLLGNGVSPMQQTERVLAAST